MKTLFSCTNPTVWCTHWTWVTRMKNLFVHDGVRLFGLGMC